MSDKKNVWGRLQDKIDEGDVEIDARATTAGCLCKFLVTAAVLVLLLLVGAGVFSWLVALG